jgi:(S)-2-hydroxyglutarate dehydrogenase
MSKVYDFAILGSGIYGVTIAKFLKRKIPEAKILLLEKRKRVEMIRDESLFVPVYKGSRFGYSDPSASFSPQKSKFKNQELAEMGYESLKKFCEEKKLDFDITGELIIATHKTEKERMSKKFSDSDSYIKKISLKDAKLKEALLNEKNLEMANFYHIESTALVDFNKLSKTLNEEISQYSDLEIVYNQEVEKISITDGVNQIKSKNLKNSSNSNFECKFLINAAGNDSLSFAHQYNLLEEYSSLKIFSQYYHANIPAKQKYPNLIISSAPYIIHPGLSFYIDSKDNKTLGPIFNISNSSYGFFKKLANLNDWRKVYQIFHENQKDPEMEFKYSSKNYVNLFYFNIFGFQMPKLFQKENRKEYENSLVYSTKKKLIEEDVITIKKDNSIHLINFNLHGGLSCLLPACEEVVNLI